MLPHKEKVNPNDKQCSSGQNRQTGGQNEMSYDVLIQSEDEKKKRKKKNQMQAELGLGSKKLIQTRPD